MLLQYSLAARWMNTFFLNCHFLGGQLFIYVISLSAKLIGEYQIYNMPVRFFCWFKRRIIEGATRYWRLCFNKCLAFIRCKRWTFTNCVTYAVSRLCAIAEWFDLDLISCSLISGCTPYSDWLFPTKEQLLITIPMW